jgi:capsular polysaccharide transport system permease protein
MILIAIILFSGAGLFGLDITPADPMAVLEAFLGLWLIGAGFGLMASVATELIPEAGKIIEFVSKPVYFISGAIFPIAIVPPPYRDWLILNPVAHGLEAARLGFAPHYHAIPELSIAYLYGFALGTLFLGLALHHRFARKLVTQ